MKIDFMNNIQDGLATIISTKQAAYIDIVDCRITYSRTDRIHKPYIHGQVSLLIREGIENGWEKGKLISIREYFTETPKIWKDHVTLIGNIVIYSRDITDKKKVRREEMFNEITQYIPQELFEETVKTLKETLEKYLM